MFMTGPAQRRGVRSTQSGTSTQQAQGIGGINPKEIALETTAPVRAIKKRKVHSIIGSTNSSGLLIQGSYEHALESADNPEGATPPGDSKSSRSPDFPISFSGLGIPKFVSPIRIASIDESLSISNNLSVNNNVDIGGILSVGGTPVSSVDPSDFMKLSVDNTALGIQNFTNQIISTNPLNSSAFYNGAIITAGGIGVQKDIFVGGKVDITGTLEVGSAKNIFSSTEDADGGGILGSLIVEGGVDIAKKLFVAGIEVTPHPDLSVFMANNSDNDGVTGEQHFTNETNASSTSVAAITTLGGVGIAQDMHLGGNLVMNGSTMTGATIGNNFSTGILSGGLMAIVDISHFSIVDGSGTVVDASNPLVVSTTPVTWSGFTNVEVGTPSAESTFVYIDSTGSVVQSIVDPTPELRRNGILLGKLFHPAVGGNDLTLINNRPESFSSPANKSTDFIFALGPVVLKGLRISANGTNLLLDRSAGDMHQEGINWHTNKQNPNIKAFVGLTGISFSRSTRDSISVVSLFTTIDPANYDNAGVVDPVGGPNATSQNMRVFMFNSGFVSVQYGQQTYSSLSNAQAGIVAEGFIVEPFTIENGVLIAVISVRKDATDLSDPSQASIFSASKFGEVSIGAGGTATSNLQNVYDNSTQPQTILSSLLGGIQIKDAATPIAAPLFEVLDSAGTAILTVEDGDLTLTGAVETDTITSTGTLVINGNLDATTTGQSQINLIDTGGQSYRMFGRQSDKNFGLYDVQENSTFLRYSGGALTGSTITLHPSKESTGTGNGGTIIEGGLGVAKKIWASNIQTTDNIHAGGSLTTVGLLDAESGMTIDNSDGIAISMSGFSGSKPAILFNGFNGSKGALAANSGQDLFFGHYDGANFQDEMKLDSNGNLVLNNQGLFEDTTESTSITTGSVVVDGGIGCAKKIWSASLETTSDIISGGNLISNTLNSSGVATQLNIGDNLTTANVVIGDNQTTGRTLINSDVTIIQGTTSLLNVASLNGSTDLTLGANTTTGDVIIGPVLTTGKVIIGNLTTEVHMAKEVYIDTLFVNGTLGEINSAAFNRDMSIGDNIVLADMTIGSNLTNTMTFSGTAATTNIQGDDINIGGTGSTVLIPGTIESNDYDTDNALGTSQLFSSAAAADIKIGEGLTTGNIILANNNATSAVAVISTQQSTSISNGALEVAGGVGIAKDVFIGGSLDVAVDVQIDGDLTITGSYPGEVLFSEQQKGNSVIAVPNSLTAMTYPKFTSVVVGADDIVKISGNMQLQDSGTSYRFHHFEIFRDTTSLHVSSQELIDVGGGASYVDQTFVYVDKPGAGTYTYNFKHYASATGLDINTSRAAFLLEVIHRPDHTNTVATWS